MSTPANKRAGRRAVNKFPAPHIEFPASGEEPRRGDLAMCVASRRPRAAGRHARAHDLARAQYSGHAPPPTPSVSSRSSRRRWRRTASRQNNRPRERHGDNNDRDRGEPRGSAPPTPPYVRVRIRRFEKLRLTRFDQGREAERFEVGIGEPHREGFTSGEMPGSTAATGRIA
jgi:hypothetical protein